MTNSGLSPTEAELLRRELEELRDRNLQESTFEEKADLVAKLGIKILPLDLTEINKEREQTGFAKVTFGLYMTS